MVKACNIQKHHRQLVLHALDQSIALGIYASFPPALTQKLDKLTEGVAVDPDILIEGEVDL